MILTTTVENIGQQTATMGLAIRASLHRTAANKVACFTPASRTVAPGAIDDERVGFHVNCKPAGRIDLALQGGNITLTPDTLDWGSC